MLECTHHIVALGQVPNGYTSTACPGYGSAVDTHTYAHAHTHTVYTTWHQSQDRRYMYVVATIQDI